MRSPVVILFVALFAHAAFALQYASKFKGRLGSLRMSHTTTLSKYEPSIRTSWPDELIGTVVVGVSANITEIDPAFTGGSPSIDICDNLRSVLYVRHGLLTGNAVAVVTWELEVAGKPQVSGGNWAPAAAAGVRRPAHPPIV